MKHHLNAEVQPCPCCAYRAEIEQVPHDSLDENSGGYYIECKRAGCGITTRLAFASMDDPLPGLVQSWNRRTARPEGLEKMQAEVARLQLLINTPELEDFDKAVPLECAHQIERWGDAHDRSKSAENWYWLVGYLAGKALRAAIDGDREKSLHHTISAAAALRNWHRAIQQDTTGAGLGADADLDAIAESTAEFKR